MKTHLASLCLHAYLSVPMREPGCVQKVELCKVPEEAPVGEPNSSPKGYLYSTAPRREWPSRHYRSAPPAWEENNDT